MNKTTFLLIVSAIVLFLVALTATIVMLMPKVFAGTVRLKITDNSTTYDPYFLEKEFEFIRSEAVLKSVIDELKLESRWGKKFGTGSALTMNEALTLLRKSIRVTSVRALSTQIEVFSKQPQEAAEIANAVAESYRSLRISSTSQAVTAISILVVEKAEPNPNPIRPKLLNVFRD